jgi:predicted  nucleic acid-binding Zn-ribbon protein
MFQFRKKPEYVTISSKPKPPAEASEADESPAEDVAGLDAPEEQGPEDADLEAEAERSPAPPPAKAEVTAGRAGRKLNLVDRNLLLKAIDEAVRNGVKRHFKKLDAKTLDQVVFGTRTELVRLLKRSSRSVRGMPKAAFLKEVEEDRARILAERDRVQAEIEAMRTQLDQRRVEVDRIQLQLMRDSRQESIQQDEALTQRLFDLFGGMEAGHELAAVREQVTFLLLQSLQAERDKVIEAQMAEHRKEVEKFERRISKLNESLELTEEELQRIAKAKGIEHGVASIYRTVQGLSGDENNLEARMEMMSSIFEANLALQKGTAA